MIQIVKEAMRVFFGIGQRCDQNEGFIALDKRFDRLEAADAAYRRANDKKVGIIKEKEINIFTLMETLIYFV